MPTRTGGRSENSDKTESIYTRGSSRQGCRPLVVEALRLSLNPVIEQMRYVRMCPRCASAHYSRSQYSIMGLFNIPNALLDGSDIMHIIKQQMIMFMMMLVSRTLSCTVMTTFTLSGCVDSEHDIRYDRVDMCRYALRRASGGVVRVIVSTVRAIIGSTKRAWISLVATVHETPLEGVIVGDGNGYGIDP